MKKRYFFECSYDGSSYSGWQIQPNALTVQEVIENRLTLLFSGSPIRIIGCGRTDAGVHALQSFFHTDLRWEESLHQLQYKLNKMLPNNIAINRIIAVNENAHARFDATLRTYHYNIHFVKSPFNTSFSYYYPYGNLDINKMNEAAEFLLGKQDFTSFSKLHTDVNNNLCEVLHAKWTNDGDQLQFEIKANRFLRNMVRAVVGTLLEIGIEKQPVEAIKLIIEAKDRRKAGWSVPACGLFLAKVEYPFIS